MLKHILLLYFLVSSLNIQAVEINKNLLKRAWLVTDIIHNKKGWHTIIGVKDILDFSIPNYVTEKNFGEDSVARYEYLIDSVNNIKIKNGKFEMKIEFLSNEMLVLTSDTYTIFYTALIKSTLEIEPEQLINNMTSKPWVYSSNESQTRIEFFTEELKTPTNDSKFKSLNFESSPLIKGWAIERYNETYFLILVLQNFSQRMTYQIEKISKNYIKGIIRKENKSNTIEFFRN
jgi:hypothetical protein